MEVKSFYSTKGGVGKTTLALNYSTYLKEVLDKNVLFINLDPQRAVEMIINNVGIDYSESLPEKPPSQYDYIVIDYPPASTLKNEPVGDLIMIANPSFLAIVEMLEEVKKFDNPIFLINKSFSNRKDQREIISDIETDNLRLFQFKEFNAIQRAENKMKTIFSLSIEEEAEIYNLAKAKLELKKIFDKF